MNTSFCSPLHYISSLSGAQVVVTNLCPVLEPFCVFELKTLLHEWRPCLIVLLVLSWSVRRIIASKVLRAALVTIPQLMENPLDERFSKEAPTTQHGNCADVRPQVLDQLRQPKQPKQPWRSSLSRLSLDQAKVPTKPTRRMQSWSLSSRDHEGMWRTVQENVSKSTRDSMSALEDFKQFRQKLADLKKVKGEVSAPPPTPKVHTPSGSIRSLNLGSLSTRSLNPTPARPTSPLQRLSVINLRKGVSGLNPKRESDPRLGVGQLPPRVHKFALGRRAEGLFKLPNPASISPLLTDRCYQMFHNSAMRTSSTVTASRRMVFTGGRTSEWKKKPAIPADANNDVEPMKGRWSPRTPSRSLRSSGGGPTRSSIVAVFSNEFESFVYSCSPRSLAALNTITPGAPRNVPQQQASKKKLEQTSVASSCSPRAKDMKGRCIHIPRPMCYSAHILE